MRIEQAIDNMPDHTAAKVVAKVATVIQTEADWVKAHITEELDARMGPRLDESNFTSVNAITTHMAKERADLNCKERMLRCNLAQKQEQEKAQKKDELQAQRKEKQEAKKKEKEEKNDLN